MKNYGLGTVSDIILENLVYRNLNPADKRLPSFDSVVQEVGLPSMAIPRKSEINYARVIVHLLKTARALDESKAKIKNIVFLGDTQLLDVTAFSNICQVGGWNGLAFIGSENSKPAKFEIKNNSDSQKIYLANRWLALDQEKSQGIFEYSFPEFCAKEGFFAGEETALVIDLDKTTLGARGRNSHVIDGARVQAVQNTIAELLGDTFDLASFKHSYDHLNQPEYHAFTTDNQDYLCYICLILQSGFMTFETLVEKVLAKEINSFSQFISLVDENKNVLPKGLLSVHEDVYRFVEAEDPTPFKAFRYNEYSTTIGRMGFVQDQEIDKMLDEEIVITREVHDLTIAWRNEGSLVFGLSDKPDEATYPPQHLASEGFLPLHKTKTHVVGS